jgi:hypothetical protein
MPLSIDHLVYATPDLDEGIRTIERLTGVTASTGGRHPGRGTRNALVALGPGAYLEIVGPDPAQEPFAARRWLGVDTVTAPSLTTWAARSADIPALIERARQAGITLGALQSGERLRTDGVRLSWTLTNPAPFIAGGVVPFFIDWGRSPHPSSSAAAGVTLIDFWIEHPDVDGVARMMDSLGLHTPVRPADRAGIVAVLEAPRGRVTLR